MRGLAVRSGWEQRGVRERQVWVDAVGARCLAARASQLQFRAAGHTSLGARDTRRGSCCIAYSLFRCEILVQLVYEIHRF